MSNIAIFPPNDAQLADMPLLASIQYFEPRPASAINRIMNGLFPNALYENFTLKPQETGLGITVLAVDGLALVKTANGESIKIEGQRNINKAVSIGVNYVYLVANFLHNTITKQVNTSSAINPADVVISSEPLNVGELLGTITVPSGATSVTTGMISYENVRRFSFGDFARQSEFEAHNHDGRYLLIQDQAVSAATADKLGGQSPAFYAKSSQVLTDVPANAVFTDTQRALSNSIASTSQTVAATSKAAKEAYDKGEQALGVANTKLDATAKAADSDRLDGHDALYFARAEQVLTDVPAGAKFTDTQRALSSAVNSTSSTVAATSAAAKTAYDRGTTALNTANTKLDATAKAVDSDKLDGHDTTYFARADQVLTDVPANAKFTDTNTWRDIVNTLTSTSTTASLSANQGRLLKGMVDQLIALVGSDDTTLDDIQEIVDFIKQNKETLDSLAISNIAGLQSALDSKFNQSDAINYVKKDADNVLTKTLQLDSTGTALVIGGSNKQATANVSMYIGNTQDEFGYLFTYEGSGTGNQNALVISTTNQGNPKEIIRSNQDGIADFPQLGAKVAGNVIWHTGNDGAGSGLDADKVDGLHASQFLRSDIDSVINGSLKVVKSTTIGTNVDNIDNAAFLIENSSGKLGFDTNEIVCTSDLLITTTKLKINGSTAWHGGNDGAGSGLDADLLDGQQGAYYAKASQVLTDVPAGAKFTDTQLAITSVVNSTSTTIAASAKAAKTAYDRGTAALNAANTKLDANAKAVDSDKLDGQHGTYYAKASQVLTNVPAGAKFTDTQRALSSAINSTSSTVAATSAAAKTAYDRGTTALNAANTKLGATAKAVDSDKLDGRDSSQFVQTTENQTIAGKKKFTNEIGLGDSAAIMYDAASDSIMFVFD